MPRTIIEQCTNCKVYDDGTILVQNVRFSYPHVDKPWAKKETDTKKHSLKGLMPKKTHVAAKNMIKKHIDKLLEEKNKGQALAKKDLFLRNGDDGAKAEEAGMFTVSASSQADAQPSVRGKDTRPIPQDKIAKSIVGGYGGDMLIKPWFQNNEHGKKVNAEIIACQLKYDSGPNWEPFGDAQRISEDDIDETFEAYEDDDSGFDEDDDEL